MAKAFFKGSLQLRSAPARKCYGALSAYARTAGLAPVAIPSVYPSGHPSGAVPKVTSACLQSSSSVMAPGQVPVHLTFRGGREGVASGMALAATTRPLASRQANVPVCP